MKKLTLINNSEKSEYYDIFYEKCDNGVALIEKLGDIIKINPLQLFLYTNEEQLDHNKFIPNDLDSLCFKKTEGNATDIIVKIKKNYFGLPKYIQVNQYAKIKDLKDILSNINPIDNLSIFLFNENGEMLIDSNTIESYNIKNKTKLTIYIGENLSVKINICNPLIKLNEFTTTQIIQTDKFVMTKSISDIKRQISEIMHIGSENLFLFTDSSCLQNIKRLIDYPIKNNSRIYGLNFRKSENINIESKPFKKGKHANIFKGKFGPQQDTIAVSKFKLNPTKIVDMKVLKYEIVTRIKLSCTLLDRFVKLYEIYEEGNHLFIAMDYIEESLESRYKSSEFQPSEIIRYSLQISEGLNYMHENCIMHRNLKCSSVLIDKEDNVKLCSFHFSKYLYNYTTTQIRKGIPGSRIDSNKRWLAPEILAGEPYGFQSDIWSLGATMIEMLTKKKPYSDKKTAVAVREIVSKRTIDYDRNLSLCCSEIIDKLIKPLPYERPTCREVKELFENALIILEGYKNIYLDNLPEEIIQINFRTSLWDYLYITFARKSYFHAFFLHLHPVYF